MKLPYLLILFCLLLSACNAPAIQTQALLETPEASVEIPVCFTATPFPTPTPSSTLTHTPTLPPSATLTSTPTLTKTPRPTITPYPIPPGIHSRDEMQQRIEDWVHGEIALSDQDLWIGESGEIAPLGLYIKVLNDVDLLFYNLGFMILEDQQGKPYLVNIAGFENRTGQRFTFAFHNGELYAPHETLTLKKFHGREINGGIQIFFGYLTPLQFVKEHYGGLEGFVSYGTTTIGSINREEYRADYYMRSSEETTQALADFLGCLDCTLEALPENLSGYVNQIPVAFESQMPYMWIYTVHSLKIF